MKNKIIQWTGYSINNSISLLHVNSLDMNSPFLSGSSSHQMLCIILAHTPNKMNKRFYTVPLQQKYPSKTIMYKYMYQNTKPRSTNVLTIFSTVKNPLAVRPPSM